MEDWGDLDFSDLDFEEENQKTIKTSFKAILINISNKKNKLS